MTCQAAACSGSAESYLTAGNKVKALFAAGSNPVPQLCCPQPVEGSEGISWWAAIVCRGGATCCSSLLFSQVKTPFCPYRTAAGHS